MTSEEFNICGYSDENAFNKLCPKNPKLGATDFIVKNVVKNICAFITKSKFFCRKNPFCFFN